MGAGGNTAALRLLCAAALAVGGTLFVLSQWRESPGAVRGSPALPRDPAGQTQAVAGSSADSAATALDGHDLGSARPGTVLPHPEHPYEDTDVDGDVVIDDAGNFVPTTLTLSLFDYFFIESGRLDDASIVQQINDWLASRLTEPALSQAQAFLAQYLAMRDLARDAYANGDLRRHPRARLALLHDLRVQAYGEDTANLLFGEEQARQLQRVERMEAAARGEITDPRLGLSPAEVATYERTRAVLASQAMAEQDIGEEALWQQRSEAFGYDAAYRLAELDAQRSAWQARLDRYNAEKAALAADKSLDDSARARRAESLLAEHFNATERKRVEALARIEAAGGGAVND